MGVQLVTPESIGTFVAVAAGTTPPSSAPVLSLSSYTDTTIDVSCTSVSGATGYKFYRDGTLVATQAGTTYQYTGLSALTTYALTCKAYNGAGDSAVSNTVTQKTYYPTIANSSLWVDFINNSYTDTSGTTAAADGDSIWTVRLPTGWGAALGDGMARQNTSANRPTFKTDGAKTVDNNTLMTLPATVSLSGAFTCWIIYNLKAVSNPLMFPIGGASASYGGMLGDMDGTGVIRCYDNAASYIQSQSRSFTSLGMFRVRRKSDNTMWFASTNVAEAAKGSTTYTWPLSRLFSRIDAGNVNNTSTRMLGIVVVAADAVTAGTSTTVENAINAAYGVTL